MRSRAIPHVASLTVLSFLVLLGLGSSDGSSNKPPSSSPGSSATGMTEQRRQEIQREKEQRVKKQEAFKRWALENTAVTDIAFAGDYTIFVTLTANKYTNRDNVRVIAESLARAMAMQTGVSFATCKVYYGREVYATGEYGH